MTVEIEDSSRHWQEVVKLPEETTTQPQGSGWIDSGKKVKQGKTYYYPAFRWYRGGKRSHQGWARIYPHQLQTVADSIRSGKPVKETLLFLRGKAENGKN